jgi:hypothetical protein
MKSTSTRVGLFLLILFCLTLSSTRPSQSAAAFVVAPNAPDVSLEPHVLDDIYCGPASSGCGCITKQATLRNLGSKPAIITGISTSKIFEQTNNCPKTLEEGRFCTIDVRHNRRLCGYGGELLVSIKDLGSPLTVTLRGINNCGDC